MEFSQIKILNQKVLDKVGDDAIGLFHIKLWWLHRLWILWTKPCKQGELVYQKGLINFCVL